ARTCRHSARDVLRAGSGGRTATIPSALEGPEGERHLRRAGFFGSAFALVLAPEQLAERTPAGLVIVVLVRRIRGLRGARPVCPSGRRSAALRGRPRFSLGPIVVGVRPHGTNRGRVLDGNRSVPGNLLRVVSHRGLDVRQRGRVASGAGLALLRAAGIV